MNHTTHNSLSPEAVKFRRRIELIRWRRRLLALLRRVVGWKAAR